MDTVKRILTSIRDGSLPFKALNRISRTKYVPSPEVYIDEFLAEHYSGESWKTLSFGAKRIYMDLHPVFSSIDINDITYVGAHTGEMALAINEAFPLRRFLLIEPVPHTFEKLRENVSSWQNMKVVKIAAGAKNEMLDMFVDNFSAASSIFAYSETAFCEFPFLGRGSKTEVEVRALDGILSDNGVKKADMLIVDVQGYEIEVFLGGSQTLESCKAVMSEMSLQDLYVGSSTFDSVYRFLSDRGFRLRYLLNPIKGGSQSILQIDGIFVRE